MGNEMKRGLMFAGALASALTAQPAAFRDSAYGQTVGGASYESLAQRPGGNYIRGTDADTRAQVLTRLGEAPFAASRPEAFANLEQAVDALMASENIPAQYRAQILATIRGNANFTNYNIRGVAPGEMSSTEVVDAMLSRNGHVIGSGVGQNVRMETPVVPGTRTGHTGYRAERWVVEAVIDGRQVLMVFTLPGECNNFSVKIIDREQAPAAQAVEASPCQEVRVTHLPNGEVIMTSMSVTFSPRLTADERGAITQCAALHLNDAGYVGNALDCREQCTDMYTTEIAALTLASLRQQGFRGVNARDFSVNGSVTRKMFRGGRNNQTEMQFFIPRNEADGTVFMPFNCPLTIVQNGRFYMSAPSGEELAGTLRNANAAGTPVEMDARRYRYWEMTLTLEGHRISVDEYQNLLRTDNNRARLVVFRRGSEAHLGNDGNFN